MLHHVCGGSFASKHPRNVHRKSRVRLAHKVYLYKVVSKQLLQSVVAML